MSSPDTVTTRVLVLSDTHGRKFGPDWPRISGKFDLVIHCGDLTQESKLSEFAETVNLLKGTDAPLKLFIAGNHDLTLDTSTFRKHLHESGIKMDDPAVLRTYGPPGAARQQLPGSEHDGLRFLDEGTHHFTLHNGASLSIYASPWTPVKEEALGAQEAGWAFQYERREPTAASAEPGHNFSIAPRTDTVVTHGPPMGVLEYIHGRRAGCPDLFAAVSRSRPQLHCFGHIHAGWGAKLATWRGEEAGSAPSHFTDIDNDHSAVVEKLSGLKPGRFDDETARATKAERLQKLTQQGFCHATPEVGRIRRNEQTMFVNAAIEGDEDMPVQLPMVVDLELPPMRTAVEAREQSGHRTSD